MLAPRPCKDCGHDFPPATRSSHRCLACKAKRKRDKTRASKRETRKQAGYVRPERTVRCVACGERFMTHGNSTRCADCQYQRNHKAREDNRGRGSRVVAGERLAFAPNPRKSISEMGMHEIADNLSNWLVLTRKWLEP